MTIVADSNGVISAKFTIPSGVTAGAKAVRVVGAGGSSGVATFTGRGEIRIEERRVVTTITDVFVSADPLAQTFALSTGRHIAAVDLWFADKGTSDVIVQIRDTLAGVPAQNVFAEQRIKTSQIENSGFATRVTFDNPVWLEANREYALVILTDNATAALHVAELGKYDAVNQRWITSQPYQVGVLLSSSNAKTWTPHQTKDLAFRLLACRFAPTSKTISMGSVPVSNISDMLINANVDIPATGANAQIVATAPSGEVFRMSPSRPINLPSRITGSIALSLNLTGTVEASPVVYPGVQLVTGDMQETGTYISRAFAIGTDARVVVTYEALLPGIATCLIEVFDGVDWIEVPFDSGSAVGDGWVERTHILPSLTVPESRIRITLSGTAGNRPRVRKLRCVATD